MESAALLMISLLMLGSTTYLFRRLFREPIGFSNRSGGESRLAMSISKGYRLTALAVLSVILIMIIFRALQMVWIYEV